VGKIRRCGGITWMRFQMFEGVRCKRGKGEGPPLSEEVQEMLN